MVNGLVNCEGLIARKRVTTERTEESAIRFVLLSEDLSDKVEYLKIYDKRENVITRITQTKNGNITKESDHNVIETKLKLPWNKTQKPEKNDLFNLKNKECQQIFKAETTNTNKISKTFEDEEDLNIATNKLFWRLKNLLHKCFRKIGPKKERINEEHERMYNLWKTLKNKEDIESIAKKMKLEEMLAEDYVQNIHPLQTMCWPSRSAHHNLYIKTAAVL